MAIMGISIVIISLSFLFYRHPPSSWPFLLWLRKLRLRRVGKQIGPLITLEIGQGVEKETIILPEKGGEGTKGEEVEQMKMKAEFDRKAMPPPPSFKMQSATALKASASLDGHQAVPEIASPLSSRSTIDHAQNSQSLRSFPTRNSIQRVSGSHDPPRLNQVPVLQPPLRSPTSPVSSPKRLPLPNRGPPISSLAPPPTHTAIPTKPSKRVLLTPGHSPLDWAYISGLPNVNLRGLPPSTPYLKVPPSLLRKYTGRKGKDAWTVLGGKVYNITPYMPYHPGGEPELMKAAGRDGTKLFGEVHPWVNWEGMLENCLVGVAVADDETRAQSPLENID